VATLGGSMQSRAAKSARLFLLPDGLISPTPGFRITVFTPITATPSARKGRKRDLKETPKERWKWHPPMAESHSRLIFPTTALK
jgi:hypothetical protein